MPQKSPSRTRRRVLVVGPWRSHTSTGCCAGDPEAISGRPAHTHPDPERVEAADLVRQLRKRVPDDVDVQLVDPRNTMFIAAAVWRDARTAGLSIATTLRQVVTATTPASLVIAGEVRSRGQLPELASVVGQLPKAWLGAP